MIRQSIIRTSATPVVLNHLLQSRVAYQRVEKKVLYDMISRMARKLGVVKQKFSLVLLVLLAFPALALPQNDPLSSAYLPSIDTNPNDYPSNIWITDTMQKVRQDSGSPGAVHWGTFYGTQNEFVDFQAHFHDTGSGTSNLSVTVSNFVQLSPSSYTISASSSNIIVYREAYMNVTQETATGVTYYNSTGYYPDALIPTVDPYHNQTTNAWPVSVSAGGNQSAWIDVHIPAAAPAGYYLGKVTVASGGTTLTTMPVIIAVWQWPGGSMPSTSSLQSLSQSAWDEPCNSFYGSYNSCGSYPGAGGSGDLGVTLGKVDLGVLMLDHRYSAINPIYPPYSTTFSGLETYYGPLYNGTAPTILSGARETTAQFAGASTTYIQNWMTEFQSKGWPTVFDYSCDEPPSTCAWSTITSNATTLHASTPPMPALVTTDIANATTNGVANSIDWMVPNIVSMDPQGGSLQRSAYNSWLSGSSGPTRQLWSYQSCSSSGTCGNGTTGGSGSTWPNVDVDGVPAANRVFEWLTFYHQQTGELYYYLTQCWSGCPGGDPWVSVYAYGGWGDGTLVYPSTVAGTTNHITLSSGSPLTYPIVVPSIRLKHWRDGMQDYEYLNVLANKGQSAFVTTEIQSWITKSYTFETSGTGLATARMALGTALHQLTYPSVSLQPPTNLTATVE